MERPDEFNPLIHGKRLFQKFLCDMGAKIEFRRVNYFKTDQFKKRRRTAQLSAYNDAYNKNMLKDSGKQKSYLSASFSGGPKNMKKRYLEAMSIVRAKGKPTLFITFTANPKWREVRENLREGQKPADRPDIVTRVFEQKLKSLLSELKGTVKKNGIFGKCIECLHVVEMQQRGLPHAHIALILENEVSVENPKNFKYYTTAELPDEIAQGRLYDIVYDRNMHMPCDGIAGHATKCLDASTDTCTKRFPKPMHKEGIYNEDGFPEYRRRSPEDGSNSYVHGDDENVITNAWVVPYNPYLTLRYDCHINVEVVSTVVAVKYLYKYMCKGLDHGWTRIGEAEEDIDECKKYMDSRVIGPTMHVTSSLAEKVKTV